MWESSEFRAHVEGRFRVPLSATTTVLAHDGWGNRFALDSHLLVLGTVGGVLLRRKHKARHRDLAIWIAAGVILTVVFLNLTADVPAVRDITHAALFLLWAVVVFGAWWSWLRLHDKEDAMQTVVSVAAVIVMGLLLITCLMPPMGHPPEADWRRQCKDNLHQIGLALHNYHEVFDSFPPQAADAPAVSWRVNLLSYLGHEDLHSNYDTSRAWDTPRNLPSARRIVPEYTCPSVPEGDRSRDGLRFTSYAVAVGPNTLWQGGRQIGLEFATDGESHTLLVLEACGQQIVWTEPRDMDVATTPVGINLPGPADGRSDGIASSYHSGGANWLLADGSVRFISAEVDPAILQSLLTADGGEEVGEF